ncbi:hypothetical protein Tco_0348674 [Tanacetum coccineum]
MPPKRTSTSEAPAMTQATIRKLVADSSEGAVGLIRWFERTESVFSRSNYTKDCKVNFATDSEKMMKVFIEGLPRSIEENVTASKPQTLEESINIAQRLMDQEEESVPQAFNSEPLILHLSFFVLIIAIDYILVPSTNKTSWDCHGVLSSSGGGV